MMFTLYDALVPPCQLRLAATLGLLDKAAEFCAEHDLPESDLVNARFADDMHPFAYQIKSLVVHCRGAIEGVRAGIFRPDRTPPPETLADLSALLRATQPWLDALSRDDVNGLSDLPVRFEGGVSFADFSGSQFLMTFSLPNFYFHATTAYDLLRWKGLGIGKRDYLGGLPFQKRV